MSEAPLPDKAARAVGRRPALALVAGLLWVLLSPTASAEPYLFNGSYRAETSQSRASQPSATLTARPRPGGSAVSARASTPKPQAVCRRLMRDPRYGYVEVRFAC